MRRRALLLAAVAAAAVAFATVLAYQEGATRMSYGSADAVRQDLAEAGIQMSSALRFSGDAAAEYCSFLAVDSGPPQYCTSTELKDGDAFVGNVHMVGAPLEPAMALGVMQSDHAASERGRIAALAHYMVEQMACSRTFDVACALLGGPGSDATRHMPCSCPAGAFPNGQESIRAWVDQTALRHASGDSPTTRSSADGLPLPVLLEVTRAPDGHLWKILVGPAP